MTGPACGSDAGKNRALRAADGCIEAAARYLATEPAAIERALAVHRAGEDGRCVGCGSAAGQWPCVIVSSARRGQAMLRNR